MCASMTANAAEAAFELAVLTTLFAAIGHPHPLFSFASNTLSRHTRFSAPPTPHSCAVIHAHIGVPAFVQDHPQARLVPADPKRL